jgi:NitT/TauT family transport system permease protein
MTQRASYLAVQTAILAAILTGWEIASRSGAVNAMLLPPFSEVATQMGRMLVSARFLENLGVTALEVVLASAIVAPIGVLIGLVLAESPYLGAAYRPFFFFLTGVPKSIFLPIFILIFGIGISQKVAFGVFQAVFVLVIATMTAASSVAPELVRLAKVSGATRWQIYREIYWPAMLPIVIEGMRLGVIFNITGVIFAEMSVSRAGIGALVAEWGRNFEIANLIGGILITALLCIAINESLRWYELRVGKWRQ